MDEADTSQGGLENRKLLAEVKHNERSKRSYYNRHAYVRSYQAGYHELNKDKIRERKRAAYKADPRKTQSKILQNLYGVTLEWLEQKSSEQDDKCSICGNFEPKKTRLSIDHDHSCCSGAKSCGACIRGLICSSCNNGLGRFRDNPALLRKAAGYIESHSAGRSNDI